MTVTVNVVGHPVCIVELVNILKYTKLRSSSATQSLIPDYTIWWYSLESDLYHPVWWSA